MSARRAWVGVAWQETDGTEPKFGPVAIKFTLPVEITPKKALAIFKLGRRDLRNHTVHAQGEVSI